MKKLTHSRIRNGMERGYGFQNLVRRSLLVQFVFGGLVSLFVTFAVITSHASAQTAIAPSPATADLDIQTAKVEYLSNLDLLVFEQTLEDTAGKTVPPAVGQVDGAPVLGYVFPTTLKPKVAGFGEVEGVLALAVTSHPDFDDTPLWDENLDRRYDNDGAIYHSHWVVLNPDERVAGGLSVKEFKEGDASVVMPPTNPGMPMYLDSPGFQVLLRDNRLQVLVPAARIRNQTDFKYDAVTAYMQVNTTDRTRPLLGVYKVYEVLSGDLSLPFSASSTNSEIGTPLLSNSLN